MTSENFFQLCMGTGKNHKRTGRLPELKGSKFFRVIKDQLIQGGDWINNDGTDGGHCGSEDCEIAKGDEKWDEDKDFPAGGPKGNSLLRTDANELWDRECFKDEDSHVKPSSLDDGRAGYVCMATDGTDRNHSQFIFIMTKEPSEMMKFDSMTCFGEVTDGLDFLEKLTDNEEGGEDNKIPFVKTH